MSHSTGYTIDDVKTKLLTLDDVRERLSYTEPVVHHDFEVGEGVNFRLEENFNHGITALNDTDEIPGFVSVGGRELQLTRSGFYDALSIIKLSKGIATTLPSHIVEDALNFLFRGGLGKGEYKVLGVRGNKAAAIARGAVQPYSNLRFLELLLNAIENKYGKGEVLVDYKFTHTLQRTHMRLIVPEYVRVMENTGTDNDTWSVGVQLKNSLTGLEQTEINGYLFRYWCTNGAIDTRNNSNAVWSRRGLVGRNEDAVFEWARDSVDEVLGGLEGSLDAVQAMTKVDLTNATAEALEDVFKEYRIPGDQRSSMIKSMINEDNLTAYTLMQAVTQAANDPDLKPVEVDRLMRVGGSLPTVSAQGRCDSTHPCGRFLAHSH